VISLDITDDGFRENLEKEKKNEKNFPVLCSHKKRKKRFLMKNDDLKDFPSKTWLASSIKVSIYFEYKQF